MKLWIRRATTSSGACGGATDEGAVERGGLLALNVNLDGGCQNGWTTCLINLSHVGTRVQTQVCYSRNAIAIVSKDMLQ